MDLRFVLALALLLLIPQTRTFLHTGAERREMSSNTASDLMPADNGGTLFNGSYLNTIFVKKNGTIVKASGTTARTAIVELEPSREYKVEAAGNDRFGICLANELYDGADVEGKIIVRDDSLSSYRFSSDNYKYAYIYVSNSSVDCPLTVVAVAEGDNGTANGIVTVKDYGAVGDGETDDTAALETAFSDCYSKKIPVVFPEGTYLIRRPLTLRSHMEIYGIGNVTVKKKASSTTTLTETLAMNGTVCHVASVSGFEVGDFLLISSRAENYPAARYCSVGYITEIDAENLTITFKSAYDGIKTGAVKDHAAGCYVTNSHAIFRSWSAWYECEQVYIHDLTLDGNRVSGEFGEWCNGCIHLDAAEASTVEGIPYSKKGSRLTCRNLLILNSPFDGISDQSTGGGLFDRCTIKNPYMNGIHLGTDYKSANIVNCDFYDTANGAGVFWCQNVRDVVIQGNQFFNCYKGCSDSEYGTDAQLAVISDNVFDNIKNYVSDFSRGKKENAGRIVINGNLIVNVNNVIGNLINRENVSFTNNVIDDFNSVPANLFVLTGSDRMMFTGNLAYGASGIFDGTPANFVNTANSWN